MSNRKYKTNETIMTTVKSWTVGKSQNKNTPFVRVQFENYIDWTGWLTPKTMERTMNTLSMLGFKGTDLGMLRESSALDMDKEIAAVIDEAREYKGKFYHSAKWINAIGGFTGKVDNKMMDEFSRIDTRAYIPNAKDISTPAEKENSFQQGNVAAPGFDAESIPF